MMLLLFLLFFSTITYSQDYALKLDGIDDFAQMDGVINFNDEITIDLEFEYYDDTDGIIIGKMRYGTDCSFYIGMNPSNIDGFGRVRWGFKTEAMGTLDSDLYFDTPESLNQNQRYRLTATYNGSDLKVYIDNTLSFETTIEPNLDGPISQTNHPIIIGKKYNNIDDDSSAYFDGLVDNVRIWNKSLDIDDLENNNQFIVLDWRFNQSGSTNNGLLYDSSCECYNGNIYDAELEYIGPLYGCSDNFAENYNSNASIDDGSCQYPDNGNYALRFDGDDYIEFDDYSFGNFSLNSYTVYIDILAEGLGAGYQRLVSKSQNFSNYRGWSIDVTPERRVRFFSGQEGTGNGYLLSNLQLANESSYQIFLSFDAVDSTVKLFINGQLDSQEDISLNISPDNQELLRFGVHNPSGAPSGPEFLNGSFINEITIWNIGFDQEKIDNVGSVSSQNLVGLWKFNEGSGNTLYDHSGNRNHGNIYGATFEEYDVGCTDSLAENFDSNANFNDSSCIYPINDNYFMRFDGQDDYIDIGNAAILNPQNLSIASWVNIGPGEGGTILGKNGNWSNSYQYYLRTLNEKPGFGVSNDGSYGSFLELFDDSIVLGDNSWHHVVGTFDGKTSRLYIDGKLSAQEESVGEGISVVDVNAYIGRYRIEEGVGSFFFDGDMDNVSLWSRELTELEVQSLMAGDPLGNESGLIGLYKFDSGSETTLYDYSGNQNHGIINGDPLLLTRIYGCADIHACNYNESATHNDVEDCEYSCHDNGNYSLKFDGYNDYVEIGDIDLLDNFMVSAKIRPDYSDMTADGMIVGKSNSYYLWIEKSLGLCAEINISGQWKGLCSPSLIPSSPFFPAENEWSEVSMSFNNETLTVSINDLILYEIPISGSPSQNDAVTSIGNAPGSNGNRWFKGVIESVNIHYEGESVVDFAFNAGLDTIAYDYSGNQNHGNISGATWISTDGCTDPLASNYNEYAYIDDGSCEGSPVDLDDYSFIGEFGGHYYYISKNETTWTDADEMARKSSGYMVSINSLEEDAFLLSHMKEDNLTRWIGLYQNIFSQDYSEPYGGWEWTNKEPLDYTNWYSNEPNDSGGENYGSITNTNNVNSWNDLGNDESITGGFKSFLEMEPGVYGCTAPNAHNFNLFAEKDDGSCSGLPSSCLEILESDLSIDSGTFYISPNDDSSYFLTYCLRYQDGAYTLISRVTNEGLEWRNPSHSSDENNWENEYVFGLLDEYQQDYKNLAYSEVKGTSVVIGYNGSQGESVVAKTSFDCIDNASMKDHFNSLSWDCPYPIEDFYGSECAHPCDVEFFSSTDEIINPAGGSEYIYFKAGEADGQDDINNDRAYISGSVRQSVSNPMGLGSSCYGGCNGDGNGSVNIGIDNDIPISPSGPMYYMIFIGSHLPVYGCTSPSACNFDSAANTDDGSCEYREEGMWYVSKDGSDSSCGSEAEPLLSIQHAIDLAEEGDSINVGSGLYIENINFKGKSISLAGSGKESTVIDGSESGSVAVVIDVEDAEISGFTLKNGSGTNIGGYVVGGALTVRNSSLSITNCSIFNNSSSSDGGAIYCDTGSTLSIVDVDINGNWSGSWGGAISCNDSDLEVADATIVENYSNGGHGGGIYLGNSNAALLRVSVDRNEAGHGGGISLRGGSSISLIETSISQNTSLSGGAGLRAEGGSVVDISNSSFNSNVSEDRGGAIYSVTNSSININQSNIENNQCVLDGAGIALDESNANISNTFFSGNTTPDDGGAIFLTSSTMDISSSHFTDNYAGWGGALLLNYTSSAVASNCLFENNSSPNGALAHLNRGSSMQMHSCTSIGNDDPFDVVVQQGVPSSLIEIFNSIVWDEEINFSRIDMYYSNVNNAGGYLGVEGGISADPLFCGDYSQSPYSLFNTSPCIGNGQDGQNMGAFDIGCEAVLGCMDPIACNLNEDANFEDGSCEYLCYYLGEYSLYFEGDEVNSGDYVAFGDVMDIGSESFTVEISFSSDDLKFGNLLRKGGHGGSSPSNTGYGIRMGHNEKIEAFVIDDNGLELLIESSVLFERGIWYQVAMVLDRGSQRFKLFVNGNEDGSLDASSIGNIDVDASLSFGALNWTNDGDYGNFWNGSIDNVRITSEALYSENYTTNYNLNPGQNTLGLYNFNRGEDGSVGNILVDYSGNRNHGSIYGAQWLEQIVDCMDEFACNYNPLAAIDSGMCSYPVYQHINGSTIEVDIYPDSSSSEAYVDLVLGNAGSCSLEVSISDLDMISCDLTGATITAGESVINSCVVESYGYESGTYTEQILVSTNDPVNPSDTINIIVSIFRPELEIEAGYFEFGEIQFDGVASDTISIYNLGNLPLSLTLEEEASPVSCSLSAETVDESGSVDLYCAVDCTSRQEISINQQLLIQSNDYMSMNTVLPISGSCVPMDSPIITSIEDIQEDQGGRVYLEFARSYFDTDVLNRVESYQIERFDDQWIGVATQNAYSSSRYKVEVATLANDQDTDFRVIANMEEGNYLSEILSGYSVDNIHPAIPSSIMAYSTENSLIMDWDSPLDIDFNYYKITDLESSFFTVDSSIEVDLNLDYNQYYINSVDSNDNESDDSDYVATYDLSTGANLVSFSVLPDDRSVGNIFSCDCVSSVIGQGQAAQCFNGNWVGSLTEIVESSGYWLLLDQNCTQVNVGSKLIKTEFDLADGANLLSFTCNTGLSIEEVVDNECVSGVIGEGEAAQNFNGSWVGSLTNLSPGKGYWFKTECATNLSYQCSEYLEPLTRTAVVEKGKLYVQSSEQSFYFFESIEGIEVGDRIDAYNGHVLVGSREWVGPYTDVPVMGKDIQPTTALYCTQGSVPGFKVVKRSGEVYDIAGPVPTWSSNGMYMVEAMSALEAPTSFALLNAYPNPFNPITTISFSVPVESNVLLEVYDINGRNIYKLKDGNIKAGYHRASWNATGRASGIYLVRMSSGTFSCTQKIMLLK